MPAEAGGVLLVHAHPDDEAFGTGGLIARSVAEGRRVDLVTCTGGEEGEIHDPTLDEEEAKPRLREIRQHGNEPVDPGNAHVLVHEHVRPEQLSADPGLVQHRPVGRSRGDHHDDTSRLRNRAGHPHGAGPHVLTGIGRD